MAKKSVTRVTSKPALTVSDPSGAPMLFFDGASTFGNEQGVVKITLAAGRNLLKNNEVATDLIAVAFLRCSIPAAVDLRNALNKALLLGVAPPTEHSN